MPERHHIRLVVAREDDGYSARWTEPEGQESESFPLELPLEAKDAAELRWYLETYHQFPGAGDHVRAQKVQARLKEWGHALFDAVFGSREGVHVYRNLMRAVEDDGRAGLMTLGATDSDILIQPWEMMRDERGPLVFQGVTIRRQLKGAERPRRVRLELPLRVLLIVSRPRDAGFIDPRNSIAPMFDALDALPAGQVTVDFCEPPTMARLEEMISEARKAKHPFHIVHFDGHGTYLPRTGIGALAFERDANDNRGELVASTRLGDLLARLDVPLVLLEACRSSDLSDRPVFGSVAPALLQSGVGSVIAFSHTVHVKAARLLVERLYRELADGLTVGQALGEARARLRADPKRWLHLGPAAEAVDLQDWFIPQLYQVGPDPALVKSDGGPTPPPAPSESVNGRLHGFPPQPMYRFHGRALELLELERAFRRYPAVLLAGMGGMGKTALAREAAAWWLRTQRFEAAVFHSFEQKAGADRVVQVIGQALEGEAFSARPAEEQWSAAVEFFRRRRILLVWDNFESTLPAFQRAEDPESPLEFGETERRRLLELYRELTEGEPAGRLLVTCRSQAAVLPGLKEMTLVGLARPDSLHLLAAVLDQKSIRTDRDGYEREAVDALLAVLEDHPLSIALVAPHLSTLKPAEIRGELRESLDRFVDVWAEEDRNRSLLASLEFSKKRLSAMARQLLPYLAWFEGGVFELFLIAFAGLNADAWGAVRSELVATALIRVEKIPEFTIRTRELPPFTTPFLRFHPTLAYAARAADVKDADAAEDRYFVIYLDVMGMVNQALGHSQSATGMVLMEREERNFRAAIRRAFQHGRRQEGAWLSETLERYLIRAGRLRERDALVAWVRSQLRRQDEGLDEATCSITRQHAVNLQIEGRTDEAIAAVRRLIARLKTEGLTDGEDPTTFEIATSYRCLAMIYVMADRPDLAMEPARKAITLFEQLTGDPARTNLAATLGDLATAHCARGQFSEAMAAAERGLEIHRALGRHRNVAAALGIIAQILSAQERYPEADAYYAEALQAARAANDLGLQATTLQHQAVLQRRSDNPRRAAELGRMAHALFQQAGNREGEMETCNLLGITEMMQERLDAAEAWFARSRELAEALGDRDMPARVAQNVGILHQARAKQTDDREGRVLHLRRAVASIEESLTVWLARENQINAAGSYSQLGILHRELGNLERAEAHSHDSLSIREPLNLPDAWKDYANLAQIARDRGDAQAAAEWQAKYDAKVAELELLRRGRGDAPPA